MAFAQVDDVCQRDDRGDEFVVEKDALEGRQVEHFAVIEEPAPEGPGLFCKAVGSLVLQKEEALALGAGIEELTDVVLRPALQTAIHQVAFGLRDEKGTDVVGELFESQGASRSWHRRDAVLPI